MTEKDGTHSLGMIDPAAVHPQYIPGPVERFGRRLKMEYVGMFSVFTIIYLMILNDPLVWWNSALATAGSFFLFLGLKKKTRDHLSCSILLFATACLVSLPLREEKLFLLFFFFGSCIWAMEGYLEKRQQRILFLPLIFLVWGLMEPSWLPGLLFVSLYLTHPWTGNWRYRRRFVRLLALSVPAGFLGTFVRFHSVLAPFSFWRENHLRVHFPEGIMLVGLGIIPALLTILYWKRLPNPHRWTILVFGILAPIDERSFLVFWMVVAIFLSATLFRQSIDSDALRPIFRHAEWHFFWLVFAVALGAMIVRFT